MKRAQGGEVRELVHMFSYLPFFLTFASYSLSLFIVLVVDDPAILAGPTVYIRHLGLYL